MGFCGTGDVKVVLIYKTGWIGRWGEWCGVRWDGRGVYVRDRR